LAGVAFIGGRSVVVIVVWNVMSGNVRIPCSGCVSSR
jgi:hypothetical protein